MPSRLQLLARARPFLPRPVWQSLRDRYWREFWRRELAEEERALGKKAAQPLAGSERVMLAEAIGDELPFAALLELGCGYGQNFHTIARALRGISLVGIDNDEAVVSEGRRLLAQQGFAGIELYAADARALDFIPARSFDLVVTCGFLLYLDPPELARVIAEMLRICRRKIILMEQDYSFIRPGHSDDLAKKCYRPDGSSYWLHDFRRAFAEQSPRAAVSIRRVEQSRWVLEHWRDCAALVEVVESTADSRTK